MPKTKNAFALKDFDGKRILQRPFFKAWRKRYSVGDELTDIAALHVIDVVDSLNATNELTAKEKNNRRLTELLKLLERLHKLIMRHANNRLEPYRRAVQKEMDSADADVHYLQSKVIREQRLVSAYIMDASTAISDLIVNVQKLWQESEQNLQIAYRRRFGERLKQARERAGLSRKDLGDAINITPNAYGLYETGKRDATTTYLIRLANKLNVSADWLIGLE